MKYMWVGHFCAYKVWHVAVNDRWTIINKQLAQPDSTAKHWQLNVSKTYMTPVCRQLMVLLLLCYMKTLHHELGDCIMSYALPKGAANVLHVTHKKPAWATGKNVYFKNKSVFMYNRLGRYDEYKSEWNWFCAYWWPQQKCTQSSKHNKLLSFDRPGQRRPHRPTWGKTSDASTCRCLSLPSWSEKYTDTLFSAPYPHSTGGMWCVVRESMSTNRYHALRL